MDKTNQGFDETGKLTYDKFAKDPKEELWEMKVKEKKEQPHIEFQRYKQDCRKRALEFAVDEIRMKGSRIFKNNENLVADIPEPKEIDVLKRADEYYTWLTRDL